MLNTIFTVCLTIWTIIPAIITITSIYLYSTKKDAKAIQFGGILCTLILYISIAIISFSTIPLILFKIFVPAFAILALNNKYYPWYKKILMTNSIYAVILVMNIIRYFGEKII